MSDANRWIDYPEVEYDPSRRPRGRRRHGMSRRPGFLSALLAFFGIVAAAGVFVISMREGIIPAREDATAPQAAAQPSAEPQKVSVPADNPIGQQAQDWGISSCLGRIVSLSDTLTRNSESQWLATRGPTDPDKEMFAATIAAKKAAAGLQEVSILHAAPAGNGGCNTAYSSTIYIAETCQKTHAIVFPTYYQRISFGSDFVDAYATADGTSRLFLFPAGEAGCVAVKTESFY